MTTTTEPLNWIKSSYSENGGQCIEWAPGHMSTAEVVPVRDSKNPTGPVLTLSPSAFAGLVTLAKSIEF